MPSKQNPQRNKQMGWLMGSFELSKQAIIYKVFFLWKPVFFFCCRRGICPTKSNINWHPPLRGSLWGGGELFSFFCLLLIILTSKFIFEDNRTFLWEKNFFFDGKPKMTKKIGFEISKPPKNTPKWRKNFWPKFFCNFFLILILSRFTNFYSILTLIPKFFCILLLLSKIFKNEVDQLHFVCFPWNFRWSIWRKLPIWRKWPFSEILVGNRQNEVVQLHFLKFWKVKEKCKKN